MAQQTSQGIVARQGLSEADQAQIRRLAELCEAHERISLKLNWEDLRLRPPGETNDLLYYDQGELVGFLGIYAFGSQRAEISGMVHPVARRRGIFRALLGAARAECTRRGFTQVLLICDRAARSGAAFAEAVGAQLAFSEHKMELDERATVSEPSGPARLRPAQPADAEVLAHILAVSFDELANEGEVLQGITRDMESGARQFYVGELGGTPIGALNLSPDGPDIGIYGFGVLPGYRGRGYGRQMLIQAIRAALAQRPRRVTLEVETRNNSALALYQSCGFTEVATYDYYRLEP